MEKLESAAATHLTDSSRGRIALESAAGTGGRAARRLTDTVADSDPSAGSSDDDGAVQNDMNGLSSSMTPAPAGVVEVEGASALGRLSGEECLPASYEPTQHT
jgi:hypothetical protein